MSKVLRLGLFGFGVVGHGLYEVLERTHGIKAEVKKICVKNEGKPRSLPLSRFTFHADELLTDPGIDAIVELIDDADAAFEILKKALANGKAVVTANKRMIAEHLGEIHALQQTYQLPVLYEAAVCASIPIIRNLEEYYDNDLIASVEGIFNGSTNYILTKVFEEGKGYTEALRDAQRLGFAESDPSLDVKGFDPKFKLAIMIAHAFGVLVPPENIVNIGIDHISDEDFQYARREGYTIKLIARAYKRGHEVYGHVTPQFVDLAHPLSNIRNEYNAVLVEGAFSEKQLFVGKGAGSYPTGSAVLSDISALTYGYHYEYKKAHQERNMTFNPSSEVEAYVHRVGEPSEPAGVYPLTELARLSEETGSCVILRQPVEDSFDVRDARVFDLKTA